MNILKDNHKQEIIVFLKDQLTKNKPSTVNFDIHRFKIDTATLRFLEGKQ
tara:strand:- start:114 stop:263 length:150 start_codon:yes stop_codon:yes gene_type:complete